MAKRKTRAWSGDAGNGRGGYENAPTFREMMAKPRKRKRGNLFTWILFWCAVCIIAARLGSAALTGIQTDLKSGGAEIICDKCHKHITSGVEINLQSFDRTPLWKIAADTATTAIFKSDAKTQSQEATNIHVELCGDCAKSVLENLK